MTICTFYVGDFYTPAKGIMIVSIRELSLVQPMTSNPLKLT